MYFLSASFNKSIIYTLITGKESGGLIDAHRIAKLIAERDSKFCGLELTSELKQRLENETTKIIEESSERVKSILSSKTKE